MKKNYKILLLFLLASFVCACEKDNYDAPEAAVEGTIIDKTTGQPMELSQGTGNFVLRIVETSFAHGDSTKVVTPQSLNMMQDGTFTNTRLFAGTYDMYPYESACYEGIESKQLVKLSNGGTASAKFEVTPYFEVEWVDEPWQDTEGYLHASIKFKTNDVPVSDSHKYTKAIPDKGQIFISTTVKVGTGSDPRYTDNELQLSSSDEGNVIDLMSKTPIDYTQKLWLRAGVKAKNNSANGVYDKYCLSKIITFDAKGVNDGKPVE